MELNQFLPLTSVSDPYSFFTDPDHVGTEGKANWKVETEDKADIQGRDCILGYSDFHNLMGFTSK
jgi:hypothetical protein